MQLVYFYKKRFNYNSDYIFANSTNIKDLDDWVYYLEKKDEPYTIYTVPNLDNETEGLNDFCIITRISDLRLL